MAKKKEKPQVINNIGELNLEIDYDKLAESIVKAQEKSKEGEGDKKFTSGAFATVISIAFRIVSIFGFLLAIATLIAPWTLIQTFVWNSVGNVIGNVFCIVFAIILFVSLCVYSIVLWKSAKEIEKEKDRNYIISVFSGVVSFAALIVALVALFKGVG